MKRRIMILDKGDTIIKSNKYRFNNNSYDDNIRHTITNNIKERQQVRKNHNKIDKIILRINMDSC